MKWWRGPALLGVLTSCVLLATACSPASGTRGGKPVTVRITEHDGTISPSGDTIAVSRTATVTFVVTSDAADQIHVHSEPDHEFAVQPGKQRFSFSIGTPGTYEVESHGLNVVIAKLQVS